MSSYVENNSQGVISGVLSYDSPDDCFVDIFSADLFLRRIPAQHSLHDISDDPKVKGFWFGLHSSVVGMLPQGTILEARSTDGETIPCSPAARVETIGVATDGGAALRAALEAGCFIDKWGALKAPFIAEPEKRKRYAQHMGGIANYFYERHSVVAFPHYGTLLGCIREGKFIDHDDDVDLSIAIYDKDLDIVVDKFFKLMYDACADGLNV
ncbi:LicD family protein [Microvirga roseola]|uniref:LicD family protein n=1 Tax=Microvirga roseola TaxID=2883126 RepID=UPI001E298D7B|nr:LicD family protein [Microvirga roseola]